MQPPGRYVISIHYGLRPEREGLHLVLQLRRSRKWLLTINNPIEHGFSHEYIREAMTNLSSCLYWCMCDEAGDECETLHTHLYAVFNNPVPHTQLDKHFPNMHRDVVKGKSSENRSYVRKEVEKFNRESDGSYEYTDSNGKLHKGIGFLLKPPDALH